MAENRHPGQPGRLSRLGEEALRAIADTSSDAVLVTDAGGCILYVNRAFERLCGYAAAELLGRKPSAVGSGLHDVAFYEALWRTIASGRVWRDELVNRRRDGRLYRVRATIVPVRGDDERIERYVSLHQPVPEGSEAGASAERTSMLVNLGLLAGGVAHDFNNLLQIVQGFGELLRSRIGPQEELERILAAVNDGAGLVRQLLALGRATPGEPVSLDLNTVVRELTPLLRRTIGEHIRVEVELDDTIRPAYLDPIQVQQVLINLVLNARDAMPGGGLLRIATAAIAAGDPSLTTLPRPAPLGGVALRVTDTGCGMDHEAVERAFEPYFTTKPEQGGTGLGLTMVQGIAQRAGGSVSLETAPGRGTMCCILVPACEAADARRASGSEPGPAGIGQGETLMLVEDLKPLREAVALLLESHGYEVLQAADGEEAVALLAARRLRVDVVITDVVMPKLSGPAMVAELRRRGLADRVIYTSGYANSAGIADGLLPPAAQILPKPFRLDALLSRLREELAA